MLEARRRTRGLGLGQELNLEHYFPDSNSPTNPPAPGKTSSAVMPNQSNAAPPPGENPSVSQSAKVKALKLQDGDITTQ